MAEESTGLQGAASRIRETAKWITVSLAAIGAVLVAGLQLTNIGQLEVNSPRFWLAILGGIIAAIGAGVVLIAASRIMTGSSVSLQSITQKPPAGTADVVKDPTLLNGYKDVDELKTEYLTAFGERNVAKTRYLKDPTNAALRTQAEAADARAVSVSNTTRELLKVVSYEHLAHSWRVAARCIIAGGVIISLIKSRSVV